MITFLQIIVSASLLVCSALFYPRIALSQQECYYYYGRYNICRNNFCKSAFDELYRPVPDGAGGYAWEVYQNPDPTYHSYAYIYLVVYKRVGDTWEVISSFSGNNNRLQYSIDNATVISDPTISPPGWSNTPPGPDSPCWSPAMMDPCVYGNMIDPDADGDGASDACDVLPQDPQHGRYLYGDYLVNGSPPYVIAMPYPHNEAMMLSASQRDAVSISLVAGETAISGIPDVMPLDEPLVAVVGRRTCSMGQWGDCTYYVSPPDAYLAGNASFSPPTNDPVAGQDVLAVEADEVDLSAAQFVLGQSDGGGIRTYTVPSSDLPTVPTEVQSQIQEYTQQDPVGQYGTPQDAVSPPADAGADSQNLQAIAQNSAITARALDEEMQEANAHLSRIEQALLDQQQQQADAQSPLQDAYTSVGGDFSARLQQFLDEIKTTSLFGLPAQLQAGIPADTGVTVISSGPTNYLGSLDFDLSQYSTVWSVLRSLILLSSVYASVKFIVR